jgi:hypothetical protein
MSEPWGDFDLRKTESQLDRFKEAARELETDDDEERFEEKLKKLVKQKPKDDDKSK